MKMLEPGRFLRMEASSSSFSMSNDHDPDNIIEPAWVNSWEYVQWTCLGLAFLASFFHLFTAVALHRAKKRMADFLLCIIALCDFSYSMLGLLQKAYNFTYAGIFIHQKDGEVDQAIFILEWITSTLSRACFLMSLFWIGHLSLLIRCGKIEDLHVRRNFLFSIFFAFMCGAMYASLPALHEIFAYRMNALILLSLQVIVLVTIMSNVVSVKSSKLAETVQGRNVIRRMTGYCICATLFTLPYSLTLLLVNRELGAGVITETFNFLMPMANAILFGTSLRCCAREDTNGNPHQDSHLSMNPPNSSLVGPTTEMIPESKVIKIGEGGSAIVYKTQWLGITVAMKCIRIPMDGGEELYMTHLSDIQMNFREEAALAAQLRHPNITLFIKLGTYKSSLCLVNEYCSKGSLRDVLKANPLIEWSTKVRLAFEASKGLAFMHNREPIYLHRDLKASNILITEDWTAKIADFGISRVATEITAKKFMTTHRDGAGALMTSTTMKNGEDLTNTNLLMGTCTEVTTFAGTWRWNAPEVMKNPNECRFNRATDIYSFGMSLWEILTNGAMPFGELAFDHQVRALVVHGQRPELPRVYLATAPPAFVELIKACWDQNPKRRPSAQDVMMKLGSLSYQIQPEQLNSVYTTTDINNTRAVFSDNFYMALDSTRSTATLGVYRQ